MEDEHDKTNSVAKTIFMILGGICLGFGGIGLAYVISLGHFPLPLLVLIPISISFGITVIVFIATGSQESVINEEAHRKYFERPRWKRNLYLWLLWLQPAISTACLFMYSPFSPPPHDPRDGWHIASWSFVLGITLPTAILLQIANHRLIHYTPDANIPPPYQPPLDNEHGGA